ncbi:MAG: dTMP kinase [Planctomycetota bacterium]
MPPPPPESDNPATPPAPLAGGDWPSRLGGRFVVFDGPDGSGKSTQFRRLVRLAEDAGVAVCEVREPGGTHIGEEIRKVLLDAQHEEEAPIDLRCEMLLFMASRAQLIAQRVRPALERGELVLADRFISSTLAYQGAGGGLPAEDILAAGRVALRGCWPDLVVVFDVDADTARARMNPLLRGQEFDTDQDRMESKGDAFHRKVRQGYLDQAAADPGHYLVIDATGEEDAVYDRMCTGLAQRVSAFERKD